MIEQIKVKTSSKVQNVAGAIANIMKNQSTLMVQTIGAGALNQAIKSIAVARGFLETSNIHLVVVPLFAEVEFDGLKKTAIKLQIKKE